jgi:glycosyltransferase involved in cell wall biosynthesis
MFVNPDSRDCYVKFKLITKNDPRIRIIGHAVDSSIFKPMKVKKPTKKILLSVGALLEVKGHEEIILAFAEIRKKHTDSELWIVGNGNNLDNLKNLANKSGIGSSVKFLGKKNHKELVALYNQCDVFLLANKQEVTPAVSEAMLCGKPVVAFSCGGIRFVIPDDRYGIVLERGNFKGYCSAVDKIISSRQIADKIGRNARKHILDNFTIEKVAAKMRNSFEEFSQSK